MESSETPDVGSWVRNAIQRYWSYSRPLDHSYTEQLCLGVLYISYIRSQRKSPILWYILTPDRVTGLASIGQF